MNYVTHRKLSLKSHPQLTEVWLHERIAENPSLLGLGELEVLARERIQHAGGRLDLLLADFENDIRYEVEVMLGATDPSHIIRTIEYWDIERRRYPAYEHIAVLVAEDITSRFLNVISLLSGTIPIVAIKLNALEVDGKVLLDFVKVLDQRALRVDDTVESTRDFEERDRAFWQAKRGPISLAICDRLLEIANEKADPPAELRWRKTRVVIAPKDSSRNAATMYPRLKSVLTKFFPENPAALAADFESAGLDVNQGARGDLRVSLSMDELREHESVVRACLHESMARAQLG